MEELEMPFRWQDVEAFRKQQVLNDLKSGIERCRIALSAFFLQNEIWLKTEYTINSLVKEYNRYLISGRRIASLPGFRGRCQICKIGQTLWGGPLICSACRKIYWSK